MGFLKLGGMTFGGLFKKKETLKYPFESKEPYKGQKGTIKHIDQKLCNLCGICAKKCPCDAIVVDRAGKTWSINHLKCIQCQYCTQNCPKKCLEMSPDKPNVATSIELEVIKIDLPDKKPVSKTISNKATDKKVNKEKKEDTKQ